MEPPKADRRVQGFVRTRYVVIASVAALFIGLAAYYELSKATRLPASVPEELRLVPRDVSLLAYANVRKVMDSALRQDLRKVTGTSGPWGQQEFYDQTGIDVEKDLDRVVAYLTPNSEGREGASPGLVLAWGRFDHARMEERHRERAGVVDEYRGTRIMIYRFGQGPAVKNDGKGDKEDKPVTDAAREFAAAFIQSGLMAIGSGPLIRRAIDLERGGDNVTRNDEFMTRVREVQQGDAWAVGWFDALTRQIEVPPAVGAQIPRLRFVSATGRVDRVLSGTLLAEAADEASAQELRDVVRGFLTFARLQGGSKAELQAALKSVELGGVGQTVSLSFSLTSGVIGMFAPGAARPGAAR